MKILLVEDSRAVALAMTAQLESFGHQVIRAASGEQAIGQFSQQSFDLILMDIEMPGMDGFEATARIRALEGGESWAWTPIIFVTATDTDDNLVTAIEAGGDDFIAKGVAESVLQAKMKAMARIAALRSRLLVANRQLREQANRDGLTGLYNRRAMEQRVDMQWARAVENAQPFSLLMIDVDHFKDYNDFYGHQAGDDCLRAIAACLERQMQAIHDDLMLPEAFAARYGGEEFVIVLPEAPPGLHAGVSARLTAAVAGLNIPHEKNPPHGVVTVSIGAACFQKAEDEIRFLFRQADELLYRAKSAGRNRAEAA